MKEPLKTANNTYSMKTFIPYLTVIALSCPLAGCFLDDEKSYDHYVSHPAELYQDYEYCGQHPGAGICLNIIKKYFRYQNNVVLGSASAFRNIDEPINGYGLN